MFSGIFIIFKKELIDTLRDRKTLIFMMAIPILAIPLLLYGVTRFVSGIQKEQAVKVVRVVASEQTHQTYRTLVHEWYLQSLIAQRKLLSTAPVIQAIFKAQPEGKERPKVPPGILTDAVVFETWLHESADLARAQIEAPTSSDSADSDDVPELPREVLDQLVAFHNVTFKGLGLIEFVDPSTLEEPPESFESPDMPEAVAGHPKARAIAYAIRGKSIHGYLEIPPEVATVERETGLTVEATFVFDSTIPLSNEARDRIRTSMRTIGEGLVVKRLDGLGLDKNFLRPLALKADTDLATASEVTLYAIGSILPYIVIVFAFLGGFYPAIDLGAGEKERNTLETLLLSPATRTEIALGKFFVIMTTSLAAAVLGVVSMAISARFIVPKELMSRLDFDLDAAIVISVALLAIPPAMAFAGMLLAVSIYARSFKEAQNYMAPLQFVIILPAMASMIPGLEMSWKMAAIPLVNVSLLARDFLKGDTNWGYYALTLASCLTLAGACLGYAVYQFNREEVLFRS